MNDTTKKHLIDLFKGLVGAMAAAALVAGMNFLGAHIPDLINFLVTLGGGVAGVKSGK